jgi:hypothetical protein
MPFREITQCLAFSLPRKLLGNSRGFGDTLWLRSFVAKGAPRDDTWYEVFL